MSCKHQNAEHMMPGDCSTADWMIAPFMAEHEQFRCIDCGAWLSLGPSRDDGEHAEQVASKRWRRHWPSPSVAHS